MYLNRDNSANYGSPLQIQRSMSNREMFGRADDLSVFAVPGGRVWGTSLGEATSAVR